MIVDWVSVSPLTPLEVNSLWDTIEAVNADLHRVLNDQEQQVAAAAAVTKKQPKRHDVKPDERGNGMGIVEEVDVELKGRGKQMKTQLEHGAMMDEANWMDELKKPSRNPKKILD